MKCLAVPLVRFFIVCFPLSLFFALEFHRLQYNSSLATEPELAKQNSGPKKTSFAEDVSETKENIDICPLH